jgi:hypothetical protein
MFQSEENRETFLGLKPAMRRPPPLTDQGAPRHNVPQDYAAALTWYRRAADQSHAGAHCNLGVFLRAGSWAPAEGRARGRTPLQARNVVRAERSATVAQRVRAACAVLEVGGFMPSETKSSGAFREPEGTDAAGERKEA